MRAWILSLVWVLAVAPAWAGEAGRWLTADLYGADVRALAVAPGDPDVVVAGTSGGQIYLSRDGGVTWADSAPRQSFLGWVVSALAFDPNQPQRLWAAFWGTWGGGLVATSQDLGATWEPLHQGLPGGQIYSLALVPGRPGWLYIGTREGVYGSRDGGASWTHLTAALPQVQKVTSLLVDEGRPETIYAGTWRRAYRSDDAGLTWYGVFEGMVLDSEVFALEAVPGRPTEIWASTCGWVYHTVDGGGHWRRHQEGLASRRTPSFRVLPDGRLLAGTVGGLYLSGDGGESWRRLTGAGLAIHAIAYHPARPERILLGTEGSGVWRSTDGGATFHRSTRGMANVRVAALTRAGGSILAAVNHAGPESGIYRSGDGGATYELERSGLPTVLALAGDGTGAWAATEKGLWERRSGEWVEVVELGQGRVEGVSAATGRVVAWADTGLWERREGRFEEVAFRHGSPRAAALAGDALWVADARGLYRLQAGENHAHVTPAAVAALQVVGEGLMLAGPEGVWWRRDPASLWTRLAPGHARALATGDPRFPLVLVADGAAHLYRRKGATLEPLDLPVPARSLTAALVTGETLLVGTSGYGTLRRSLTGGEKAGEAP